MFGFDIVFDAVCFFCLRILVCRNMMQHDCLPMAPTDKAETDDKVTRLTKIESFLVACLR